MDEQQPFKFSQQALVLKALRGIVLLDIPLALIAVVTVPGYSTRNDETSRAHLLQRHQ